MRIERLELFHVSVPLPATQRLASHPGHSQPSNELTFARLTTDDGIVGEAGGSRSAAFTPGSATRSGRSSWVATRRTSKDSSTCSKPAPRSVFVSPGSSQRPRRPRHPLARGCLDVLQTDAIFALGIAGSRKVAALAEAHGLGFAPHCWSNGFSLIANLHVMAASTNCELCEFPYEPPAWVPQSRDALFAAPVRLDAERLRAAATGVGARAGDRRRSTEEVRREDLRRSSVGRGHPPRTTKATGMGSVVRLAPAETGRMTSESAFGKLHGEHDAMDLSSRTETLAVELLKLLRTPGDHASARSREQELDACQALRNELDEYLEVPENRLSVARSRSLFQFVELYASRHSLPVKGALHLDIGCGPVNPYGRMFTHLMAGVGRAACLDLDPIHDEARAAHALARLAAAVVLDPSRVFGGIQLSPRQVLANIEDFDLAKLAKGDPSGINPERLRFLSRSVTNTGFADASVDMVFSNSVLEHMPDMDASMAELARITKPGGYGMHGIDVRDHRWYGDPSIHPLEFLTIESREPIVHICNRLRWCEHEGIFARHGFTVLEAEREAHITLPTELRERLVQPWRSMTDEQLSTTWTVYLVRKTTPRRPARLRFQELRDRWRPGARRPWVELASDAESQPSGDS